MTSCQWMNALDFSIEMPLNRSASSNAFFHSATLLATQPAVVRGDSFNVGFSGSDCDGFSSKAFFFCTFLLRKRPFHTQGRNSLKRDFGFFSMEKRVFTPFVSAETCNYNKSLITNVFQWLFHALMFFSLPIFRFVFFLFHFFLQFNTFFYVFVEGFSLARAHTHAHKKRWCASATVRNKRIESKRTKKKKEEREKMWRKKKEEECTAEATVSLNFIVHYGYLFCFERNRTRQ